MQCRIQYQNHDTEAVGNLRDVSLLRMKQSFRGIGRMPPAARRSLGAQGSLYMPTLRLLPATCSRSHLVDDENNGTLDRCSP